MAKWEDNKYVIEAKDEVVQSRKDLAEAEELFNKYTEQVKAIDPRLFDWMESGFGMSQFYTEMNIENNLDWLYDSKRSYDNRVAGAKKASETRRANKLKLV